MNMKNVKKYLALFLVLALCLSLFAGCSKKEAESQAEEAVEEAEEAVEEAAEETEEAAEEATEEAAEEEAAEEEATEEAAEEEATEEEGEEDDEDEIDPYTVESGELYEATLGEFNELYQVGKAEVDNVSLRYAEMAIAEAKLMEAAVMLPTTSAGGNYAISRIAPYSGNFALWGSDGDRYHQYLIVDGDPIAKEDYLEMRAKWAELRGTGEFADWQKQFLADKGYTLTDVYQQTFTNLPVTWDALNTSRAADTDAIINTFDGLVEYNFEGEMKPALATEWEVSEDRLTYTFKIREGAVWVDSQGREVAKVKADDFVAGMQHAFDAQGGLEWLVQGVIKGASEYITGETADFSTVGVSAPDDQTLIYTLEQPTPYFLTMLGYSIFAPMSREYYESQGGKFGEEFDDTADSYQYAIDQDHIAYCGPYLVTNATEQNKIQFEANPTYWNADGINIHTIIWNYNDGSDDTKTYNDFVNGDLSGLGLNDARLQMAKSDGMFDKYAYVAQTNATSYMGFLNINRAAFANVNDASAAVSAQTPEDAARTKEAMRNVHFRRALCTALDRGDWNAQKVGDELKNASLINSYTCWNFVTLEEEVTVDINGTATTFPAGTYYSEIEQAQLDADGVAIKVFDPEADNGNGAGSGYDGWYNPEYSASELAIAVEELGAAGVEVSAEKPIIVDLPFPTARTAYANAAQAFKKSVEATTNGLIQVNLVECVGDDDWYYAGYYTDYGYEANYDIYDLSGWGPDYGDPSTYLDTFLPDYAGYMIKCIGIF